MSSYTEGQIHQLANALEAVGFTADEVTKLGQFPELGKLRAVVCGKMVITEPTCNWREQDGVIYLAVTSNGMTGPQWIKHLEKKGFRLSDYAKSVLRSSDFKPTKGVRYEIAILKGMLFKDEDRITSKIRFHAGNGVFQGRKLTTPNAEVTCLIRENFSDEDIEAMGLIWIVTMHEPIRDSDGDPRLLDADRDGDGRWLHAYCDGPGYGWGREYGFAFVLSQVSPQPSDHVH